MSGWPGHCGEPKCQPYFLHRHELTVEDGCILWGRRVVIPSGPQHHMLSELHECHPGMSRMKALARSFEWWPGLDQDIKNLVGFCITCSATQRSPKPVPLLLWPWATEPWQRIHVDFCEIKGQTFLLWLTAILNG